MGFIEMQPQEASPSRGLMEQLARYPLVKTLIERRSLTDTQRDHQTSWHRHAGA